MDFGSTWEGEKRAAARAALESVALARISNGSGGTGLKLGETVCQEGLQFNKGS